MKIILSLLMLCTFSGSVHCQVNYKNLKGKEKLEYDLIKTLLIAKLYDVVIVNKDANIKNDELIALNYVTYPYPISSQKAFRPWDIEYNLAKEKTSFKWNKGASRITEVKSGFYNGTIFYNNEKKIYKIMDSKVPVYDKLDYPYTSTRDFCEITYDKTDNISSITDYRTFFKTDSLTSVIDSITKICSEKVFASDKSNNLVKCDRKNYCLYYCKNDSPSVISHNLFEIEYSGDSLKLFCSNLLENKKERYTYIYKNNNLIGIDYLEYKYNYKWSEKVEINSLGFASKYSRITPSKKEWYELQLTYNYDIVWQEYKVECILRYLNEKGDCYLERNTETRKERRKVNGEWSDWK